MGVTGPSDPVLERISPIKHLDAGNVPVLLIHGRDDTVVRFEQSQVMFDAMKHPARPQSAGLRTRDRGRGEPCHGIFDEANSRCE